MSETVRKILELLAVEQEERERGKAKQEDNSVVVSAFGAFENKNLETQKLSSWKLFSQF